MLLHDADSGKKIWVDSGIVKLAIELYDGNTRLVLSELFSMGTSSSEYAATMYSKFLTVSESVDEVMEMRKNA